MLLVQQVKSIEISLSGQREERQGQPERQATESFGLIQRRDQRCGQQSDHTDGEGPGGDQVERRQDEEIEDQILTQNRIRQSRFCGPVEEQRIQWPVDAVCQSEQDAEYERGGGGDSPEELGWRDYQGLSAELDHGPALASSRGHPP